MTRTIVELFEAQVHHSSIRPALRSFRDGVWEDTSWKEWWDLSERLAAGLIESGVAPGDKVCVVVSTRVEWVVIDMAIAMAGAISIPLPTSAAGVHLGEVLSFHEVKWAVVEDPVQLSKVVASLDNGGNLQEVIYLEEDVFVAAPGRGGGDFLRIEAILAPEGVAVNSLEAVMAKGRAALAEETRFVARRRRALDGEGAATIVYTAGVSDRPRAVVLTHSNLSAQVDALARLGLFSSDDVQLLFMPLAHILTRVMYLCGLGSGLTTAFGRGPERLLEDLQELRPTVLASVPRVFERLEEEVHRRVDRRGLRKRLLPLALEVGKAVSRRTLGGDRVGHLLGWEHRVVSKLLLEDVQAWLGGKMRFLISGGAPLKKSTGEFFFSTGVLVLEGYGLTETSGVVAFNMPDDFRLGSVGKPLPGVDVTIAEDGEVLVRGDTVMKGYLDSGGMEPGVDAEGWFHTGDIGFFDREGFLTLTDRKKELIITSTGKHIFPGALEESLSAHSLVAHAILVGEGRPYLAAALVMDSDGLLQFLEERDIGQDRTLGELGEDPRLRQELQRHIDEVNRGSASFERIRRFLILPEFLSLQNQLLAASGTVRRNEVLRRYRQEIEDLYMEEGRGKNF